jgi:hypothetical protein
MTKLIVAFRYFANAPKNRLGGQEILYHIYGTEDLYLDVKNKNEIRHKQ